MRSITMIYAETALQVENIEPHAKKDKIEIKQLYRTFVKQIEKRVLVPKCGPTNFFRNLGAVKNL